MKRIPTVPISEVSAYMLGKALEYRVQNIEKESKMMEEIMYRVYGKDDLGIITEMKYAVSRLKYNQKIVDMILQEMEYRMTIESLLD